jgi:hypothetical protein
MTIKQIGGVFGRNPTFNDVVVDDEITVNGSADINGNADISGTLSFPDLSIVGTGNAIYTNTTGAAFFRSSQMLFQNAAGTVGYATINSNGIVMPNGLGIDFSATSGTGTSELFDDYEEGTWSPTVATDGADGTYTVTVNTATYTKVGNSVRVSFYVTVAVTVVPTGAVSIGGLPFNAAEDTAFSNALDTLTASTGNGYLLAGSPIMRFTEAGSASWKDMVAGAVTKYVMVSAVYRSA